MGLITLTSDFGPTEYVATMKGVILSIAEDARIVDISHAVQPQDVAHGAYVMYSAIPHFPEGIHVGVVDPGVGTERKAIIVECENHRLVGPDNGLLIPVGKKLGLERVIEITNKEYMLESISSTFHGRDIFAPVAAHLSLGVAIDDIGEETDDWVDLHFGLYQVSKRELKGRVLHVDSFGNLITNIPADRVLRKFDFGQKFELRAAGKRVSAPFLSTYSEVKESEVLVTVSSSEFLELAANRGSAAEKLGAGRGDEIMLHPSR